MGVTLNHLSFQYGDTRIVDNVSLVVESGELFGLLGPSGCGKTTTLRMIAGFFSPSHGTIAIAGRDVTHTPPEQRHIGMVFQNYALFPHMTVAENVAFGLTAQGVPKKEQRERIANALSLVQLDGMERRPVPDLSGGQQQRVALARALVIEPRVLLLDEPLSNLDARLRTQTGAELRALQQRLRITTVYVTHDQSEALSLCDRIAIMREGKVEQVGTPEELYRKPVNRVVTDFLGRSNLLPISAVSYDNNGWTVNIGAVQLRGLTETSRGVAQTLSVRPHSVSIVQKDDESENTVLARVVSRKFLGSDVDIVVNVEFGGDAGTLPVTVLARPDEIAADLAPDDLVRVRFPANAIRILTA